MKKGTYGYIKEKKKRQIMYTVIIAVIAIIIFVVGYLLNKNSRNNVFTIVSILLALPGAKMLVGFIVVAPYHSMDKDKYDKLCKVVPANATMLSDLVITSSEKVMNLDCIVVDDRHVLALLGKATQDTSYIQTYLARIIKNHGFVCEVKLLSDFDKYLLRVKTLENDVNKKNRLQDNEIISEVADASDDEVTKENDQAEIVQLIITFIV